LALNNSGLITLRRALKKAYAEATVINFLRVKAVEQLRIEGLTTRGQHQRVSVKAAARRARARSSVDEGVQGEPEADESEPAPDE